MKKHLFIFGFVLIAVVGVLFSGGSRFNWGGSLVVDGLEKGLTSFKGLSLVNSSVTGNPVMGYELGPMRLLDGNGVTVAAVRSLRFRLDLMALLKRKVVLSSVVLNGVRVEEFLLSEIPMANNDSSSSSVDVGTVELMDVASLYGGGWSLKSARIRREGGLWNSDIEGTWREEALSGEALVSLADGKAMVKRMKLTLGGGVVTCSGRAYPGLALSGDVVGVKFEDLSRLYPAMARASLTGGLSASYRVEGRLADPVLSGSLEVAHGGVIDISLHNIEGNWLYSRGKLSLNDLRGQAFSSPVSGDVSIDFNGIPSLYDLRFTGKDLSAHDWVVPFPWLDFMKDVKMNDMKVALAGPIKSLSGSFDFFGASGDLYGFELIDTEGNASLKDLKDLKLDVKGEWLGSGLSCSGAIDLDKSYAKLDIKASQVHLNRLGEQWSELKDLKLEGNSHASIAITGPFSKLSVAGDLRSDRLRVDGVLLEKGSASFKYDGANIILKGFKAMLKKAAVKGSGRIKHGHAGYSIDISGSADGVNGASLKDLVPALGSLSPVGKLNVKWRYSGVPADGALYLNLSSPNISLYRVFPLKNFTGKATVRGGSVTLEGIKSSLFGGSVSLSGRVNYTGKSGVNLNGAIKSLKAASLMSALGAPPGEGIVNGSFNVTGSAQAPVFDLKTSVKSLKMGGVELKPLSMTFKSSGEKLKVAIDGKLSGSSLKGSGWVRFPSGKDKGALDLVATTEGLDIGSLVPKDVQAGGNISLKVHLLGKLGQAKLYLEGKAPRFQVGNVNFSNVEMGGYAGKKKDMSFTASSQFGDRRINASCDLVPEGKSWALNFEASGKDISVAGLEPGLAPLVTGRVDLDMKGILREKGISANGKLTGKSITAKGLKFKGVSLPLVVSGSSVSINSGKGAFYGGKADLNFKIDLSKNRWSGKASVKDFDIEPVLKAGAKLAGRISGRGTLKMDLNGISGRAFLMNITGYFRGKSVELNDFSVISEVTKGKPLRIRDISANFNLDGQELFLLPGSRASAWPEDKLYRYFDVSGSAWNSSSNEKKKASPLDLNCSGEVNLRAFNVFLGALHSLLRASIDTLKDPKALATDLLSGIVGGYSATEFREVRLHLGGNWGSPVISRLKVGERQEYSESTIPDASSTGAPSGSGETKIQIKINVPTGEGSGSGVDTGDQVKKQLMENLLKQVIGDSDENN